jgi:predicted RNA binding protein YcfA (HicA-like mRNA interferase family)
MTRAPRITGKSLVRALEKAGFLVIRTKGSHHYLRHPDGRWVVVPVHSGEILGPGLIVKILQACDMSLGELRNLL